MLCFLCCHCSVCHAFDVLLRGHSYPGTVDAINFSSRPVYIITTKQTRFAQALLKAAGVSGDKVPVERIFGHGSGSKISTLNKILDMPENAGCHIQYVGCRGQATRCAFVSAGSWRRWRNSARRACVHALSCRLCAAVFCWFSDKQPLAYECAVCFLFPALRVGGVMVCCRY